jgi:hypothetical protein
MIRTAAVVAVAALLAVPARAQQAQNQWKDEALRGQSSSICEKKMVVVKSERQWEQLWKDHSGEAAKPPKVDFSHEMVVAVFLGQRNKAGYQIDIVTMPDPLDKNKLVIFYKEIAPHGDFAAEMITHPYAMVKVKIHSSVTFETNQDAGVLPGESPKAPRQRINEDQRVRIYDSVNKLEDFGSFDGFNRP